MKLYKKGVLDNVLQIAMFSTINHPPPNYAKWFSRIEGALSPHSYNCVVFMQLYVDNRDNNL